MKDRAERGGAAKAAGAAALLLVAAVPAPARAADEEIQVYMDEMNPAGGYGLDLHLNDVIEGRRANADYTGQEASQARARMTPEFSYGLTRNLEAGLYLPLGEIDPRGGPEIGGVKGRLKFIAPHAPDARFFWGANFELGYVRHSLDINPWNAEAKAVAGWRKGPLTLAANLNFDFTVAGPAPAPATFQLAAKASYALNPRLAFGLESYTYLGDTHRIAINGRGDHQLYAVLDTAIGRFDLNLGVGYGYGRPEDRWIVKAIIGIPIDPRQR